MRAVALILTLLICAPAESRPTKLPPIDQCSKGTDFAPFLGELKRVVAARDRDAFLAVMAKDMVVDFDGSSGPGEFAKQWSFDSTEYGNVWDLVDRMLVMGCARVGEMRVIPSLIEQFPTDTDHELFDSRLVLPGAKLFRVPGDRATAMDVSAWTVVEATDTGGDLWTGVRLPDGRKGWISDDDLYEPLGYRMTIEKRGPYWRITAFVAGD